MKTIKLLTLAAAALIAAGGWTQTLAQDTNATGLGPPSGRLLQHIARRLNLTDDQQAQIKSILGADRDTLSGLMGRMQEARHSLRASIQAPDATEASVRAASARVAAVEADFAVERMKLYAKIAPVLTDPQRRRLADLEQRLGRPGGGLDGRSDH